MVPFKRPFTTSFLRVPAFAVFLGLVCSTALSAQTLMWNANTESNLAGYRVQYGTVSGNPSTTIDVGRVTSRTITGLQAGTTYYFRVVAYNTAGQSSAPSAQVSYTVPGTPTTPSPTLTSVSPASGPTAGGTTITLTGTNFVSGATVRVGGVAATGVSFASSTRLTARTPAGTGGAKDVVVTNPNGRTATRAGGFTYTSTSGGTLTATSVSPTSGPPSGGTNITVAGTGFVSGAVVLIGGTPATNVTFVSSTKLTARTPAKAAGGYTVQVRNPNGQIVNTPHGFLYTGSSAPPPPSGTTPTATAVSPLSGPTTGGTLITVTGTNFVSGATIKIGGVAATGVKFVSSTRLTARTPKMPVGGYPVLVFNPNGKWANTPRGFTYVKSGTSSAEETTAARTSTAGLPADSGAGDTLAADAVATERTAVDGAIDGAASGAAVDPQGDDADGDGLPAEWETRYGLDPASAVGDDGAAGDPDGDGVSNADELAAGTHPRGLVKRYLAEGIESEQMHTRFAIANPDAGDAHVLLTFTNADGVTTQRNVDVPARSRRTLDLSTVAELAGASFSTVLESDLVVALDRRVALDPAGRATTLAAAIDEPSATWYFAERPTAAPFEQFYLVQNPGDTDAQVQVRYLPPGGAEPIERTHTVAAHSRASIWVDREAPALASTTVGAQITSLDGTPIVVERTVYTTEAGSPVPRSGVTDAGITSLDASVGSARDSSARWLIADGESGSGRPAAAGIAIANQGAATDVTVTLLFEDGPEATATFPVAAGARLDLPLAQAFPAASGRRFSILVEGADPAAALVADRTIPRAGAARTAAIEAAATRLP